MAMKFELTREIVDNLKEAVNNNDETAVFEQIKDLHSADIAELYGGLTLDEAKYVYLLLDSEMAPHLQ